MDIIKLIFQFVLKHLFKIVSIIFLAFLIIIPFYNSSEVTFRVHDNLDSLGHLVILSKSGQFFNLNPNFIVKEILNGTPRSFLGSPFSFNLIIYHFLGIFKGLLVNNFLVRIVGFLSMFFFLKHFKWPFNNLDRNIIWVISSIFASLPVYYASGLGPMSIPAFLYLFYKMNLKEAKLLHYFLLVIICSYTFLFHIGIYAVLFSFIYFLIITFKKKEINLQFLYGILVLSICYISIEYMTIYNTFFSSNFISHRVQMSCSKTVLNFNGLIGLSFKKLLNGNYHSASYSGGFILIVFLISLISQIKSVKKEYSSIFIFIISIIISLISTSFSWKKFQFLYDNFDFFCKFNFSRIDFFLSFSMILLLMFSLKNLKNALYDKFYSILILVFSLFIYFNISLLNKFKKDGEEVKFIKFESKEIFNEINNEINYKSLKFNVASLGIDPSVLMMNGCSTIDGYFNNYLLSHKLKFRKIIKKELDKDEFQKAYFDNWGNRCYIPLIDEKCENIDLNERGLIDMNCKYLFSKLELKKTNFKLVKRFRNQSCRFNEIFVYQIF